MCWLCTTGTRRRAAISSGASWVVTVSSPVKLRWSRNLKRDSRACKSTSKPTPACFGSVCRPSNQMPGNQRRTLWRSSSYRAWGIGDDASRSVTHLLRKSHLIAPHFPYPSIIPGQQEFFDAVRQPVISGSSALSLANPNDVPKRRELCTELIVDFHAVSPRLSD